MVANDSWGPWGSFVWNPLQRAQHCTTTANSSDSLVLKNRKALSNGQNRSFVRNFGLGFFLVAF